MDWSLPGLYVCPLSDEATHRDAATSDPSDLTRSEGWHNNHHAKASRARHGLKSWELDPTFGLARLLEMVGLVRNLRQ
jgi:hypothetical protein